MDGYFAPADGSTASRYELEDFTARMTDVEIPLSSNFHMFRFLRDGTGEEALGFSYDGTEYFDFDLPMEELRAEHGDYGMYPILDK